MESLASTVLVSAPTPEHGRALLRALTFLGRGIDFVAQNEMPQGFGGYRLLICELGAGLRSPAPLLGLLRRDAHVILLLPELDVRWASYFMQDERISHLVATPFLVTDLQNIVAKLESGSIFGLERCLPARLAVRYHRIRTYDDRCQAIEQLRSEARAQKIRAHHLRAVEAVVEELLMNAMYSAPVDAKGRPIFAEVDPRDRIKLKSAQRVSLRYAFPRDAVYVSVRDRYGTLTRKHVAQYLRKCTAEGQRLDDKKLGAGIGLYQVLVRCSHYYCNIMPGSISETICVIPPPGQTNPLRVVSVTTQRPAEL